MAKPIAYVAYGVLSPTRAHSVQVRQTIEALQRTGSKVIFINPNWKESWSDDTDAPLNVPSSRSLLVARAGLYDFGRRISPRGRFWWLLLDRSLYGWRIAIALSRIRPRAIITRDIIAANWLTATRWLHKAPVVYECHNLEQMTFLASPNGTPSSASDFAPHQNDDSLAGRAYARMIKAVENRTLRKCEAVVTLTAALARHLNNEHGIRVSAVIPSAQTLAPRQLTQEQYRVSLALPINKRIALYSGLTFSGKGVDLLLDIGKHLAEGFLIVIIGGTPDEYRSLQRKLNESTSSRVLLRPRVLPGLVHQYLYAADVGLLLYPDSPSLGICSSPLKLAEYLAAGLPTIATPSAATSEAIADGVNGVIVTSRDPRVIAGTLMAVMADSTTLASMRCHARCSGTQRTHDTRARQLLAVVNSVATSSE